jgi:hypothetical protein
VLFFDPVLRELDAEVLQLTPEVDSLLAGSEETVGQTQ